MDSSPTLTLPVEKLTDGESLQAASLVPVGFIRCPLDPAHIIALPMLISHMQTEHVNDLSPQENNLPSVSSDPLPILSSSEVCNTSVIKDRDIFPISEEPLTEVSKIRSDIFSEKNSPDHVWLSDSESVFCDSKEEPALSPTTEEISHMTTIFMNNDYESFPNIASEDVDEETRYRMMFPERFIDHPPLENTRHVLHISYQAQTPIPNLKMFAFLDDFFCSTNPSKRPYRFQHVPQKSFYFVECKTPEHAKALLRTHGPRTTLCHGNIYISWAKLVPSGFFTPAWWEESGTSSVDPGKAYLSPAYSPPPLPPLSPPSNACDYLQEEDSRSKRQASLTRGWNEISPPSLLPRRRNDNSISDTPKASYNSYIDKGSMYETSSNPHASPYAETHDYSYDNVSSNFLGSSRVNEANFHDSFSTPSQGLTQVNNRRNIALRGQYHPRNRIRERYPSDMELSPSLPPSAVPSQHQAPLFSPAENVISIVTASGQLCLETVTKRNFSDIERHLYHLFARLAPVRDLQLPGKGAHFVVEFLPVRSTEEAESLMRRIKELAKTSPYLVNAVPKLYQ